MSNKTEGKIGNRPRLSPTVEAGNVAHPLLTLKKQVQLKNTAIYGPLLFILSNPAFPGEIYSAQGRELGSQINHELIKRGFCKNAEECHKKMPLYGEYGKQVHLNIYGIDDVEKRAGMAIIFQLATEKGIDITNGTPITIWVFNKPHEEYVNFKNFFSKSPIITLEIVK